MSLIKLVVLATHEVFIHDGFHVTNDVPTHDVFLLQKLTPGNKKHFFNRPSRFEMGPTGKD